MCFALPPVPSPSTPPPPSPVFSLSLPLLLLLLQLTATARPGEIESEGAEVARRSSTLCCVCRRRGAEQPRGGERKTDEYSTMSDWSESCGHTETRQWENTSAPNNKSPRGRLLDTVLETSTRSRWSQSQIQWPHLVLCLWTEKKKNRALEWPHCIHSRCLAILHIFYAAAGENYSTGSRPGGFERTSQI